MTEKSGFNIPWASLAVLAAFVSSVLLPQRAFEPLRPAEKDSAAASRPAELEVEARLWEDPFRAMRRHESERKARCANVEKGPAQPADCDEVALRTGRGPAELWARLDRNGDGDLDDVLLVLALVPGNAFVGAEESRRRTRYALLAGFHAKDYVPDNAERVGIGHFRWSAQRGVGQIEESLDVPYEMLSQRPLLRSDKTRSAERHAHIALLWIDETALPGPKLDNLARVLGQLLHKSIAKAPKLAVIGPSSSDSLRIALQDLDLAARKPPGPGDVADGYRWLATADIIGPSASAPDAQFEVLAGARLEDFVATRLSRFAAPGASAPAPMLRTIAPDNEVLDALVKELRLRLPTASRRIVLIAERDSLYAQALVTGMSDRIGRSGCGETGCVERQYYFRGIDGITTREGAEPAAKDKPDPQAAIEWPESRDQLDYLRRMAGSLKLSEAVTGNVPIGAIGILGHDVHDKLLVLQALRETFPDKVFFTTDMDARYLHPRTQAFTRNLVVASSLPLEFAPALQAGVPPLRDVYQAAAYLAARRAACRGAACKAEEDRISEPARREPSVYEIGRTRAIAVAGYDHRIQAGASNASRAMAAAGFVTVLTVALLVWPSTPSLRLAMIPLLAGGAGGAAARRRVRWPHALLAGAQVSLLAFAVGSAGEFMHAGSLGASGTLTLALLPGLVVLMACCLPLRGLARADRHWIAWVLLAGAVLVLAWFARVSWREELCLECEPVAWLEGISAWPSQLIRLLALAAGGVALDYVWRDALAARYTDSKWLALSPKSLPEERRIDPLRHPLRWFGSITVLCWRLEDQGHVEFAELWPQYMHRGCAAARLARVLIWYGVTLLVVALLFPAFSDGYVLEVPVRGADHRRLVSWTLALALLLLPLLTVAVADATTLASHFIQLLGRGRTVYPPATVIRFATALGAEHREAWIAPLAADPAARVRSWPPGPADVHSLLDDWIDVQVVARRTDHTSKYVLGPFLVLALLVVAHSRLFDNWALTLPIACAAGAYLVWLVLLSALLKTKAERLRQAALARMNADLRWLAGVDGGALVEPFERLIRSVENNTTGAFAPLLEQPFVRALLVPLGGAGGAQLFDHFLLGH